MIHAKVDIKPAAYQRELMIKAKAGDQEAHDALVLQFLPMIEKIAGKFARGSKSLTTGDFISEGTIGVINAIRTFDLNRKIAVSTHMYGAIFGYIHRAKTNDRLVNINENLVLRIKAFEQGKPAFKQPARTIIRKGKPYTYPHNAFKDITNDQVDLLYASEGPTLQVKDDMLIDPSFAKFTADLHNKELTTIALSLLNQADREFIQDVFGIGTKKLDWPKMCKKWKANSITIAAMKNRILKRLRGEEDVEPVL